MDLDVRVRKIEGKGNLKAYADVTFNGSFVVKGVKVLMGNNGLFLGMPSRKAVGQDGKEEFRDIAHPITKEFKQEFDTAVLEAYNAA